MSLDQQSLRDALAALAMSPLLLAWGNAKLVTERRDLRFRYRLTGVLVRKGERWLWRVDHGSEPGSW